MDRFRPVSLGPFCLRLQRKLALVFVAAIALGSCGGGEPGVPLLGSQSPPVQTAAKPQVPASPGVVGDVTVTGTQDHPRYLICGLEVAPNVIRATVVGVYDGDTITLDSVPPISVRLEGIDAPERAQEFGQESQSRLAALVLNRTVTVAHSKNDKYGRVVGSVFTDNCVYANLEQVASGMAWFYRRYQCELEGPLRELFANAESEARSAKRGLWQQSSPQPPWVFRNGVDPAVPVCGSNLSESAALVAMPLADLSIADLVSQGSATSGSDPGPSFGSCGPKTTCGQMSSCAEAQQYLRCGLKGLDRDNDGVACDEVVQALRLSS